MGASGGFDSTKALIVAARAMDLVGRAHQRRAGEALPRTIGFEIGIKQVEDRIWLR
ncbi:MULTISPECIES: hypothetical protein [unclassified Mesorhizobium]|uniref:hypothetical protein n=1 Tax=unclassified Mesorhizobium TaxID=325217 RepID=UPI0015CD7FDC|nr:MULTISPECIES: hypothetical protein [unclassified Mesorhizobium]